MQSDSGGRGARCQKRWMRLRDGGISVCEEKLRGHGRCDYARLLDQYCLLRIGCAIVEDRKVREDFAKGGSGNGNGDGNYDYCPLHLLLESLVRDQLDVCLNYRNCLGLKLLVLIQLL